MKTLKTLLSAGVTGITLCIAAPAFSAPEDIYAIKFSQDGRHLVTGGFAGHSLEYDKNFTGGIKVWDADTGDLVKAFGQQSHIHTIFGDHYGRIGKRRWAIHSFKDVVLNGSYPNGKILLLPSSLGHIKAKGDVALPDFFGGYMDFEGTETRRIPLTIKPVTRTACDNGNGYEYIGPVVSSSNGRYAAVVVNTCKEKNDRDVPIAQYDSALHIVDLQTFKVKKSYPKLDSGIYAAGISNNGQRIAYVGRDSFSVLDVDSGKRRDIETYENNVFQIPRQFSQLYFDKDARKLVSLHYIYDVESGTETELKWKKDSAVTKGRTSNVKVAPDLSYFVLVKPKRSLIVFGEDGLPRAYGKADKIFVVDLKTGEERELALTDARTEGKKCVTDISPDGKRIAVGCAGGLIKVFEARSGELIWEQRNEAWKKHKLDRKLKQVRDGTWPLYALAMP